MANIDNLNFKVILDDVNFNKKVHDDIALAKQLNTQLTTLLQVKAKVNTMSAKDAAAAKRASSVAATQAINQEKIKKATSETAVSQQRLATEVQRTATATNNAAAAAQRHKTEVQRTATEAARTENATNRAAISQQRLNKATSQTSRNMRTASKAAGQMNVSFNNAFGTFMQFAAFGGMASLIKSVVRITGEFELQRTTLAAMLDDLGAAEHLLGKLKTLSLESPFTFKELGGFAKQLTAFSIPKEELFETTNMIANISAGLGVAADRLILAYGQVKSAAFLRGQEVRQFTEAGIPILQDLAKEFEKLEGRAVSVGEVFDRISTRQVSFEMIAKVLRNMTSEGGKFYQMQQIQAGTIWGKLQNLKGQWQVALDEMGKKNGTFIHNVIDGLTSMVKNWEKVGKVLRTVIIAFGAYKAAILSAWVIQKSMMAYKIAAYFVRAAIGVNTFAAAIRAAKVSMSGLLGFFGLVGGAIYALITNSSDAAESTHNLSDELDKLYSQSVSAKHAFDIDIERLKTLQRGTEAYREALEKLNTTYSDYLPKLLTEADSYETISQAAEKATHAISEKARQEVIQKMREERDRQFEADKKAYDDFLNWANGEELAFFNKVLETLPPDISTAHSPLFDHIYSVAEEFYASQGGYAGWMDKVENAIKYLIKIQESDKEIYKKAAAIFTDATYDSLEEYEGLIELAKKRDTKLANLKLKNLESSEYRNEELMIEKQYLKDLIDLYSKLDNITMADKYRKELEELENFERSWRGKVQNLLQDEGYNENRSFGLWPTEYTSSVDFIDKILKDYKEVSDNLEKLHFDPAQEKSLKDQKKIIEAIADLLNIDLTTGKRKGRGKSELEKKIDALSALKKAYDSLKELNLGDTTIIQMLKENFPDIVSTYGESFIDALDFTNRILEFGRQLKATDPDRANSLLQSLGLDNLSNDKKTIMDAIDAAKKYFEAIRKWQTSDFSIEGEGVAFDIGKIANQLSTKFNEIELNSKKITETFNQIDLSKPEAVEAVKWPS